MSRDYIDRSNDEEIIDIIRNIMSQGTMTVETINESIFVSLMEKRGTPISIYVTQRDVQKDFKWWKSKK